MEDVTPEVGMGCTIGIGSDRYAGTVRRVLKRAVDVSWDGSFADGRVERFTRCQDGRYRRKGTYRLTLGVREDYRDPCF